MHDRTDLSEKQHRMLLCIEEHIVEFGRPPSNREIGTALQINSTGHVDYHLKALERKGYIKRDLNVSRGIRLTNTVQALPSQQTSGIPIMGTIAAGQPLDLYQGQHETLDILNPARYQRNAYALRVHGDSMIEDGILEDDIVIIEPTKSVNTRDIIVATNIAAGENGAATLKRFFREDNRIRLQPANKNYDPIFVDARQWDTSWQIQGKVVAVIRSFDTVR